MRAALSARPPAPPTTPLRRLLPLRLLLHTCGLHRRAVPLQGAPRCASTGPDGGAQRSSRVDASHRPLPPQPARPLPRAPAAPPPQARPRVLLGIESSCDDTGAAVVTSDGRVLGEALAGQVEIHAPWGAPRDAPP